ncbi:MAG: sugar phosphate nucleotidyltransferase [Bacteroidaceae bacterium]
MSRKAMILAAGLGTRLASLTSNKPKALVELWGKPLLYHVTKKLVENGFNDITINVHHFADQIMAYVETEQYRSLTNSVNAKIKISDETNLLLDTGGALLHAASLLFAENDKAVLVHNVDIMSNANISELYDNGGINDASLLVSQRETQRFLLFNSDKRLVGWTNIATQEVKTPFPYLETKSCTKRAFAGIHLVTKRAVDTMETIGQSKFSIIDFYIKNADKLLIKAVEQDNLSITDVGKIEILNRLNNSQ